ncbi:MAG: kdpE [Chloroflexi bacterium]|nr:kdpE [Chloroflexota bacterium]
MTGVAVGAGVGVALALVAGGVGEGVRVGFGVRLGFRVGLVLGFFFLASGWAWVLTSARQRACPGLATGHAASYASSGRSAATVVAGEAPVAAIGAPHPQTATASVSIAMATLSARAPRIRQPPSSRRHLEAATSGMTQDGGETVRGVASDNARMDTVPAGSLRILVVEDDRALRGMLVAAAEGAGYRVVAVGDGLAAGRELRAHAFDAVLLDIGLPLVDGWHILADLEGRRVPPVIVISARGEERDKVRALDMGADDYLAKPFGSDELLARLRAVLRRARPPAEPSRLVEAGGVSVDLGTRTVLRGGEEVRLSPTERALLVELARHAGRVVDHRSLLRRVWGPEYAGERNYLRTFVQRLRLKLEADPADPRLIVTVDREGYRFGPPAPPSRATPAPGG